MLLAGVLLLALQALPAQAARDGLGTEVAVVGVHLEGQDDGEALRNARQLVGALEAAGLSPVDPAAVHDRLAGREALVLEGAASGLGRRKRDEGRILYDRADFEGAIPVLEEAAKALEEGLRATGDPRELVQALLLLGQTQWSLGENDAARDAFSRVIVLDPSRQLDPVNYPPKIVAFFTDVRYEVLARPMARLQLQIPDMVTLLLDGRETGPGTVELVPGTHYALASDREGQRRFVRLELDPGQTTVLEARPTERRLAEAGETPAERGTQTRMLYSSLGIHIGTGLVLLGGEVDDGRVGLQLYEPRTGSFSQVVSAPMGEDPVDTLAGLASSVAGFTTDNGNLRADRISFDVAALDIEDNPLLASLLLDPTPLAEPPSTGRKTPWYLWAGVGAVAAGGAAVVAATLLTDEPPAEVPAPTNGVIIVGPLP